MIQLGKAIRVHTAKNARDFLGLSSNEIAQELTRLTGAKVVKQMVAHWDAGRRFPPSKIVQAYGRLIANKLTQDAGRVIGVKVSINSPWQISCWAQCRTCARWFALTHPGQKNCPRCR